MSAHQPSQGLQIRYCWGDTLLQVTHHERPREVFVGSTQRCELRVSPPSGQPAEHALVCGWEGAFALNLAQAMSGVLTREGAETVLAPGSWDLEEGDQARVELGGGLRADLLFRPTPKRVAAAWFRTVDARFVNLALLCAFLAGLFVITATQRSDIDLVADDLTSRQLASVRVRYVPPPPPRARPVRPLDVLAAVPEPSSPEPFSASRPGVSAPPGKQGKGLPGLPNLKAIAAWRPTALGAAVGIDGVFGSSGPGVGEGVTRASLQGLQPAAMGDNGLGGLASRGGPAGGGNGVGGSTIGIGSPMGRLAAGYGQRFARLSPKATFGGPQVFNEPPQIAGSLDKDLVRQVIRENVGKVRFCYEESLQHNPSLAGKVAVRFVIGRDGQVRSASVDDGSTLSDAALSACLLSRVRGLVFPAPKSGGEVTVRYPFVFKSAGE